MKDLSKRGLDHKEKLKVWSLWLQGKALSETGLTVDRHAGSRSISAMVSQHGTDLSLYRARRIMRDLGLVSCQLLDTHTRRQCSLMLPCLTN